MDENLALTLFLPRRANPDPCTLDGFGGWAAHQTVSSVACINNPDCEILAALQTVETVVCNLRHRLDADKVPMSSASWTWQGFCRDLDPCWFE